MKYASERWVGDSTPHSLGWEHGGDDEFEELARIERLAARCASSAVEVDAIDDDRSPEDTHRSIYDELILRARRRERIRARELRSGSLRAS